ncbi:hypothetical protein ABT052_10280 [Streptomyces sp. NPDC002766]|uniref:hypothetical protein n=1 Tax=Streptomyces sp. NPDC002766 TaxID=3154429 RepID=UPI0033328185
MRQAPAERRTPNAERRTPNAERRTPNAERRTPYVKDGIGRYVVDGESDAVDPAREGTKDAARTTS